MKSFDLTNGRDMGQPHEKLWAQIVKKTILPINTLL